MGNLNPADLLLAGDYVSAQENLDIEKYPLIFAYALFLSGDFERADCVLTHIDSIRANWLRKLIILFTHGKMVRPTYFEIRNFLELDIDLFIISQRINYLEKLLGYSKQLADVNRETYKLIGRVLFNNNLLALSKTFLDLYKNMVYYDPELHFIYAKYYIIQKDYNSALTSINQCLMVLPEYYPALLLKSEIKNLLEKS